MKNSDTEGLSNTKFFIKNLSTSSDLEYAHKIIMSIDGVEDAKFDSKNKFVTVRFNISKCSIELIISKLNDLYFCAIPIIENVPKDKRFTDLNPLTILTIVFMLFNLISIPLFLFLQQKINPKIFNYICLGITNILIIYTFYSIHKQRKSGSNYDFNFLILFGAIINYINQESFNNIVILTILSLINLLAIFVKNKIFFKVISKFLN